MTTTETAIQPQRIVQNPSLYRISEAFADLDEIMESQGEGATVEDADVVAAWYAELSGSLTDKLTGCVAWVRSRELFAGNAKAEATRLDNLARAETAKVERLKKLIREVFEANNLKKVETPLGPVRIVGNGGRAPLILDDGVFNIETVPADCKRVVVEPVKDAIRTRLEAGEVIEGARIGERGSRVSIG